MRVKKNHSSPPSLDKLKSHQPAHSGLSTDSGLVFMGDIMGKVSAYDKDTVQEMWSFVLT
jgi:hypothetical protein